MDLSHLPMIVLSKIFTGMFSQWKAMFCIATCSRLGNPGSWIDRKHCSTTTVSYPIQVAKAVGCFDRPCLDVPIPGPRSWVILVQDLSIVLYQCIRERSQSWLFDDPLLCDMLASNPWHLLALSSSWLQCFISHECLSHFEVPLLSEKADREWSWSRHKV